MRANRPKMVRVGLIRSSKQAVLSATLAIAVIVAGAISAAALGADLTKHFRSDVQRISPPVTGLSARVLNRDEQLELANQSGRTVVVEGYDREPYLRFEPNGTVFENERSPATYLNRDRLGLEQIPADATPGARPVWRKVATGGRYRWFDHR